MKHFKGKLGLQQRVLPNYRAPFFDALAERCRGGLSILAGQPRAQEAIELAESLQSARVFPANNVHYLGGRFYVYRQMGLGAWLNAWQPDVLIMETNPRNLSNPFALRWMHAHQRPVIGWGLGSWGGLLRSGLLKRMDALITYSQQGAEQYARAGIRLERIFVAPNAMAPRPKLPMPERPPAFIGGQAVVLFVGRLQPRKRVDLLLRACAALPPSMRPHLLVVGDGPARADLEALAASVYPQAEFLGARYGAELEAVFRTADLFVLPGTGGLAIQQAMSFGLPVMAAEADGTQNDLVRPGNGWQLTPGSLDSLVAALQDALEAPIRLRMMGRVSYQIVDEQINLERMVEVFLQAIASVI